MKYARECHAENIKVFSIYLDCRDFGLDSDPELFRRLAKTVKKYKAQNPSAGVSALVGPYAVDTWGLCIDVHFSV